jgi:hypothetical protein
MNRRRSLVRVASAACSVLVGVRWGTAAQTKHITFICNAFGRLHGAIHLVDSLVDIDKVVTSNGEMGQDVI